MKGLVLLLAFVALVLPWHCVASKVAVPVSEEEKASLLAGEDILSVFVIMLVVGIASYHVLAFTRIPYTALLLVGPIYVAFDLVGITMHNDVAVTLSPPQHDTHNCSNLQNTNTLTTPCLQFKFHERLTNVCLQCTFFGPAKRVSLLPILLLLLLQ